MVADYPSGMPDDEALSRLPLGDRLELLAFDARLTGTPEPLVQAIWEAADALAASTSVDELRRGYAP